MSIIIENTTSSPVEVPDIGITIDSMGTYDISGKALIDRLSSKNIIPLLGNLTLIVRDSLNNPYSPELALKAIREESFPGKQVNGIDVITRYRFWSRFTLTEKIAMQASTDALVKVVVKNLELAEFIDLNDPDVGPALDVLVAYGVIAYERKAVIMAI